MKIIKKIIAIVLCLLMVCSFGYVSAGAKTVFTVGDWIYEKINNNTEFEVDEYIGTSSEVTTEGAYNTLSITSIGENAFTENATLKKITFSVSLKFVQNNAFTNATMLSTVVCTPEITKIGAYAFAGCSSLSDINLEDTSLTEISNSSFMNCDSLVEVRLPYTLETISKNAFAYCDGLKKIVIPESVTAIDERAFYNSNSVVIYCYKDSYAQSFAEANAIEHVVLEHNDTYVHGDSDGDGVVSVVDATYLQFGLAQKIEVDEKLVVRGDVDRDGTISVMDATLIQQHIASLLFDSYDIGKTFEY